MKKLIGIAVVMTLLAGCETLQKKETSAASETRAETASAASTNSAVSQKKLGPKARARKDAEDKKTAQQAGSGGRTQEVKGINGWSGQIVGTPVKGKFSKLKIGMGLNEVISIAGRPTDTSSHITGKAWIPFYFGSGRYETIFYYKGVGRLTFAGGAGAYAIGVNDGSGLSIIEYDRSERGFQ